jgi:hypothetical protein
MNWKENFHIKESSHRGIASVANGLSEVSKITVGEKL